MIFRCLLAFAAMIAFASPAMCQIQPSVPLYTGQVTAANSERFTVTLANHVDEVVGLQIAFDPISVGNTLTDESPNGGAFISHADSYSGGVQINIPDAYLRHGQWIADGFYTVKYGGMGQGIMGYLLRPADEASIRLSSRPIVATDIEELPDVERDQTAD